ncbi:MAG TPA: hypothetical protein VL588_11275 [Bdellovibrionota bacterium]|nr:hypothetical protein [Bdellovibrionota bacterium]
MVDEKLRAQGFKIDQPEDTYLSRRDATIERMRKENKEHPWLSGAGTVTGVLASGIAMGGAMAPRAVAAEGAGLGARAAAAGARVYQAAKTGAAMGFLANPGDTKGEFSPVQLDERMGNAKAGAITGGAIQGLVEVAPAVINGIRAVGRKLGSVASGLSSDVIDHYAQRTEEVNKLIRDSGGQMTEAADQVRQEAQDAIRKTRAGYSAQITKALESAPKDPVADTAPIISQLEKVKGQLNPNLQDGAVAQIDNTIEKLQAEGAKNGGKVSIQQLNQITDFLQERAKGSYTRDGQIFANPKEAARAAKGAAAVSRKMLNALSPDIAEANNKLALLHGIEDRLNPNLIAPGKPDAALFAAGSGGNPRNAKMLERLAEQSGYPILNRAKDLAAAKTFANASYLPADATGKSVARQLILAGAGHAVAGPMGYLAGGLASPAAVKAGINASQRLSGVGPALASAIERNPALLPTITQNIVNPQDNRNPPAAAPNQLLETEPRNANRAPAKGPDAWARAGASRLGIADSATAQRAMQSPAGKRLLIEASNLPAGHKRLKAIREQLQKGWGSR